MNLSLPVSMKNWVNARPKDGSFSNTSDHVRRLIRRDPEGAQAIASLRHAIDADVQSGKPEPFDVKAFKTRMRERHGRT